jgi:hypothetical protein
LSSENENKKVLRSLEKELFGESVSVMLKLGHIIDVYNLGSCTYILKALFPA